MSPLVHNVWLLRHTHKNPPTQLIWAITPHLHYSSAAAPQLHYLMAMTLHVNDSLGKMMEWGWEKSEKRGIHEGVSRSRGSNTQLGSEKDLKPTQEKPLCCFISQNRSNRPWRSLMRFVRSEENKSSEFSPVQEPKSSKESSRCDPHISLSGD